MKKWIVKWEFTALGRDREGVDEYGFVLFAWLRVLRLLLDKDVWSVRIDRLY